MPVFHAYDIRGKYPQEIDEDFAYRLGRLAQGFLAAKTIMVARDERTSSPSLCRSLVKGLRESGTHVVFVGLCSTPEAYYSQEYLHLSAAIMVTASHNPKEYNGFKLLGHKGKPIGLADGLDRLAAAMDKPLPPQARKKGTYKRTNVLKAYTQHMLKGVRRFPFRIVFDQSNSAATGEKRALRQMAHIVARINTDPDGTFPGHDPNPLKRSSQRKTKALKPKRFVNLSGWKMGVIFS